MLTAFNAGSKWDYRLYVHFNDKSVEPPWQLSVDALKYCLTEHKRKPVRETILHYDGIDDDVLADFASRFTIKIGPSFEEQRRVVYRELTKALRGSARDAEEVHYGNALAHIIDLSVRPAEEDRRTSRSSFLAQVNKRPVLYNRWHRELVGEEKFLRSAEAMLKRSKALTPLTRRGLVVSVHDPACGIEQLVSLVEFLTTNGFGTGRLTNAVPWTILFDAANDDIAAVKEGLAKAGVKFNDGYEDYYFNTAIFDQPPVINTRARSSIVERSSYSVRVLSAQTFAKHAAGLKPLKTLISFSPLEPSRYTDASLVSSVRAPAVGVDRIISFLRGAQ
jgi:hypothetical protein